MSVARRGESGAASASSYWRLSQRRIQSSCWAAAATRRRWAAAARASRSCWAAAATRRRWAAAARASRSCWAAEATRRRWAGAARASRNSAVPSGPIITRAAKPPIAATTRITAIPIANISYNNIGSPPPLAVGTKPLAYFLKFHFQRENAKRHHPRHGPQAQAKWLPLLPNFEHADLVSGSRHARKSLARLRQGSFAAPFHCAPAKLFLTLASSAAPKFQSQQASRQHLNHYAIPAIY